MMWDLIATAQQTQPWEDLSARERRIFVTKVAGEAWERLVHQQEELILSSFLRTGCLISADGFGDDEIRPQQFPEAYHTTIPKGGIADVSSQCFMLQVPWGDPAHDISLGDLIAVRVETDDMEVPRAI